MRAPRTERIIVLTALLLLFALLFLGSVRGRRRQLVRAQAPPADAGGRRRACGRRTLRTLLRAPGRRGRHRNHERGDEVLGCVPDSLYNAQVGERTQGTINDASTRARPTRPAVPPADATADETTRADAQSHVRRQGNGGGPCRLIFRLSGLLHVATVRAHARVQLKKIISSKDHFRSQCPKSIRRTSRRPSSTHAAPSSALRLDRPHALPEA